MKFKQRILSHFGLDEPGFYEGAAFHHYFENVYEAMKSGEFLVLIGDPGCGKKTVVAEVVRKIYKQNEQAANGFHHIVYVQAVDKERINIASVERAMIYDLSDENPKRGAETRSRQLSTILGVITNRLPAETVTVIIEQGHLMHGNTIRALKQLLELRFLDKSEMFGIVLMGHRSLKKKINGLNDVAERVEFEFMSSGIGDEDWQWLSKDDRAAFLKARWGNVLTPQMRLQIATVCKTPLAMDRLVYDKMKAVFQRGDEKFKESDFMLDIKTVMEAANISNSDVATIAGCARSTVSLVANGKYQGDPAVAEQVRKAVARLTADTTRISA